jgi:prepilin-type N-terminal cleavage/methylation domain-containing protein
MYTNKCRHGRRGFTLIELLVVIAIISVLAAILFPVFLTAKKRANMTKCGSNQRQIAQSIFQYCDDWNGRLPVFPPLASDSFYLANHPTVKCLYRYVKNRPIYRCPGGGSDMDYDIIMPFGNKVRHEVDYRFNPQAVGLGQMKTLSSCANPKIYYLLQDRHSINHKASREEEMKLWVMLTVAADGHVMWDVRPYDPVWQDKTPYQYKYNHWDDY